MNMYRERSVQEKIDRLPYRATLLGGVLVLVALVTLAVSVVSGVNIKTLRDIQHSNDCKSTITADDQRAANGLILAIAGGISTAAAPTPAERLAYQKAVSDAAARLAVTQDRRAHINEICAPSKKGTP